MHTGRITTFSKYTLQKVLVIKIMFTVCSSLGSLRYRVREERGMED